MKTPFVLVLGGLVLLSGCSVGASYDYPSALTSPEREKRSCEVWGGYWNRTVNICEGQKG